MYDKCIWCGKEINKEKDYFIYDGKSFCCNNCMESYKAAFSVKDCRCDNEYCELCNE